MYTISSSLVEDEKNSFCLKYDTASITRFTLDEEESNLLSGPITRFVWNETFVCRLVDLSFVLLSELSDSAKTIRLTNNQYSFTRALQSILNTSSNILDIEYYDNELWFLYDSYEIQHYNLCSKKWAGVLPIDLFLNMFKLMCRPTRDTLPRRMSGGFIRILSDRLLLVYQVPSGGYHFYMLNFPNCTFLKEITAPVSHSVIFPNCLFI